MSEFIYAFIVAFVLFFAVGAAQAAEPTIAELKAQIDRVEQAQRHAEVKARLEAFRARHRETARKHHRRGLGLCTANC